MNLAVIYRKSARANEALAARDRSLTPKLRSLLILVDGKRTHSELAQMTMQADVTPLLDQLIEMGMLEEGTPAPMTPANGAPAAAAPGPAQGATVPLVEAQRFAARRLTDLLGPSAEDMCMKIESTRNAQDFMAVIQRVETMLRNIRGDRMADDFVHDMESHRPG
jgi:hypothetical protein